MNYKAILRMLSNIMMLEALFFLPSMGLAVYDGDYHVLQSFMITIVLLVAFSLLFRLISRNDKSSFFVREGFTLVGLTWIVMSLFGALPFFISGEIPGYFDAFFETVSGFTTTGASILRNVEEMSRSLLLWRSFTHWLGGMGIIVFMLAFIPAAKGRGESLHVLRAESPGPTLEKIVPKTREHSMILYGLYTGLSIICFLFLYLGGMPLFDSVCTTFGTAGTGGFGIKADSMGSYSSYCQIVVTVFMALFGVNFNIYFLIAMRRFRAAFKDEEMRVYFGIMLGTVLLVGINIAGMFDNLGDAFHHAAFSVSSVMTTTGYATVDFNQWPQFARGMLMLLMVIGASAGSTAGGVKVSRIILMLKSCYREIRRLLHPRSIMPVRMNGHVVPENTIRGVNIYGVVYICIYIASFLLVSIDDFSFETNATAVLTCLSNVGPGFGMVGPTGNFADFSVLSKLVLSLDMLLGRLEIFPLLLLFHYRTWSRNS